MDQPITHGTHRLTTVRKQCTQSHFNVDECQENVLVFWRDHCFKNPPLYMIVWVVLYILASSLSREHAFSSAGGVFEALLIGWILELTSTVSRAQRGKERIVPVSFTPSSSVRTSESKMVHSFALCLFHSPNICWSRGTACYVLKITLLTQVKSNFWLYMFSNFLATHAVFTCENLFDCSCVLHISI